MTKKLDQMLRRRFYRWRNMINDGWASASPAQINEKGYLCANYNPLGFGYSVEETPILAFPPGCKGEGDTTEDEWQPDQLPPFAHMSAYLLFRHFCWSSDPDVFNDPDVFLEPHPTSMRVTIGAGRYVSIVLECDRSITIYPTPYALEEINSLLKMPSDDAFCELFEDLACNGWNLDTEYCEQLTEDGQFCPSESTDEGSFWAYGWQFDDHVYRSLSQDILLRGKATMSYFRNDISDEQMNFLRRNYPRPDGEPSLAQQLADACGYEVIIH